MKRKFLDKFIFSMFKKAAKSNPATRHGVFMFDEENGQIVVDYPTERSNTWSDMKPCYLEITATDKLKIVKRFYKPARHSKK